MKHLEKPLYDNPSNRTARKAKGRRMFNNKKGIQVVITPYGRGQFSKTYKKFQRIGKKLILHYETK